jgi:hypothetical protein
MKAGELNDKRSGVWGRRIEVGQHRSVTVCVEGGGGGKLLIGDFEM